MEICAHVCSGGTGAMVGQVADQECDTKRHQASTTVTRRYILKWRFAKKCKLLITQTSTTAARTIKNV
jgi:hypothetical protein